MKNNNSTIIFFFILLFVSTSAFSSEEQILKILKASAENSGIELDGSAIGFLKSEYLRLEKKDREKIDMTNQIKLADQVGKYLSATKETVGLKLLDKKHFIGFRWDWLIHNNSFMGMIWDVNKNFYVNQIAMCGTPVDFATAVTDKGLSANIAILPSDVTTSCSLTTSGKLGNKSIVWTTTGNWKAMATQKDWQSKGMIPLAVVVSFPQAYGQGCEIHIASNPDKATIYLNKKKFYRETNTKTARKAGKWSVRISKKGFDEKIKEKTLTKGEIWVIDVDLVKSEK